MRENSRCAHRLFSYRQHDR
jgi:ATP-dependent exoDNAse (exonuclease V) alpha subunit